MLKACLDRRDADDFKRLGWLRPVRSRGVPARMGRELDVGVGMVKQRRATSMQSDCCDGAMQLLHEHFTANFPWLFL
jgi:hypothetical protein